MNIELKFLIEIKILIELKFATLLCKVFTHFGKNEVNSRLVDPTLNPG